MKYPELVVMLTYNDTTVEQAFRIFEECRQTDAKYWGFKEKPLPMEQMKELAGYMKACGKTTFLEVVAYNEEECLEGAKAAAECQVDYLMGTLFYDSVNDLCRENGIRYMPFVGRVTGRPSILEGTAGEMIDEARRYIEKGAYGIDLLGYRYTGDAVRLNSAIIQALSEMNAPVCLAGSVNSFQRLDEVKDANPGLFTIGSAFFDHAFGDSFAGQINRVCSYIRGDGI